MISIVILTLNEEIDIDRCINSVKWSNDIHILDSGSTDGTLKIAHRYNVSISSNDFLSFARQRNFALENLDIKNDWVLFLDADEQATNEFRESLFLAITKAAEEVVGFYCCWKMILEDRWLKNSDNFPKWQFRVVRKGKARFTDSGHGQKEAYDSGRIEYLKEPYLHYGFSKGWQNWIDRHNKYSSLEAEARLKFPVTFKSVFNHDSGRRTMFVKSIVSKCPGWPIIRFIYTYIFRLGLIEGVPGLIYCSNMCYYEFLIQIKMREIRKKKLIDNINE